MSTARIVRTVRLVGVSLAVVALAFAATGCGDKAEKDSATTESKGTAKAGLTIATSALETMAPDARLLVVQTAQSVTPTASPVWVYLFGSPKTDKTYAVYVSEGKLMGSQEYGEAGLTKEQWADVPDPSAWVVDDDVAYQAALDVSGAKGEPAGHFMGLQTYVPSSTAGPTSKSFVWYVYFDPGQSGATTATIQVDAKSGEAQVVKQP